MLSHGSQKLFKILSNPQKVYNFKPRLKLSVVVLSSSYSNNCVSSSVSNFQDNTRFTHLVFWESCNIPHVELTLKIILCATYQSILGSLTPLILRQHKTIVLFLVFDSKLLESCVLTIFTLESYFVVYVVIT